MNEIIRLQPGVWPAQPLTPEAAERHVEGGSARADSVERTGRAFRRLAWIVGSVGATMGLLGLGAGAYVLINAEPQRPMYSLVNPATGHVEPAVAASDAPRLFTADTAKQYLRMFVETCGGYNHVTREQNYSRCTALMTPQQQAKYHRAFTSTNPSSPQNTIGMSAVLVPENLRPTTQPGSGRIQSWLVRYIQAEYRNGQRVRGVPWSAIVHFEWRPETRMSDEARSWNTAGMRVVDYSFGPDTAP